MKRQRAVRILMVAVSLVALLGLSAQTVAAAPAPQSGERQSGLFGEVVSVGDGSLVVKTKDGEIELSATADTQYRAPENDDATLLDLSTGDRIAAMVLREDGQTIAVTVMFVPTKGKVVHITGVIAEVAEGTAVIVTEDGRRVTVEFGLSGNIPEAGTVATIVGRLDADTGVLRARSVQRLNQTLKRLNHHIAEVEDAALDRDAQIKHVARVQRLLENISARQLKLVNGLLERLPDAARPALDRALRNLEEANQSATRALDQALVLAGHQERERQQPDRLEAQHLPKSARPTLHDVAQALNITADALAQRLGEDATLAQLAQEAGFDEEAFGERVVAIVMERLQAVVDEGRLTPEALDLIAAELRSRVGSLIVRIFTHNEDVRPDLPFSVEDIAAILEVEPAKLYALLREGESILHIAEQLGVPRDRLIELLVALSRQRVQALLENGTIRPKDVDHLLEKVGERIGERIDESPKAGRDDRPDRDRPDRDTDHVRNPFDLKLVARILGMSQEALITRLIEGGTLSEVAEQGGVGLDELVDKLTAAMKKKLAEMVEEGDIDPEHARRLLEEARERLVQSIREFRHSNLDREDERPEWSPAAQLYKNIPLTFQHVAEALGISVDKLQKWMHEDHGVRPLLEERGIDPEELVARLMSIVESEYSQAVSRGDLPRERAERLLAQLKRRLFSDLRLTHTARPAVSDAAHIARPVSFVSFNIAIVARSLELSANDLRRSLSSGHTIAETAERLGVSLDKLVEALVHPLEEQIREAIESGRIDEENAREKLQDTRQTFLRALRTFHLPEPNVVRPTVRPDQPPIIRPAPGVPFNVSIVARILGTSGEELRTQMARGLTVAEIAKTRDISLDEVVKALLAPVRKELREAVANGTVSEEEAKRRLQSARETITHALEGVVASIDRSTHTEERSSGSDDAGRTVRPADDQHVEDEEYDEGSVAKDETDVNRDAATTEEAADRSGSSDDVTNTTEETDALDSAVDESTDTVTATTSEQPSNEDDSLSADTQDGSEEPDKEEASRAA